MVLPSDQSNVSPCRPSIQPQIEPFFRRPRSRWHLKLKATFDKQWQLCMSNNPFKNSLSLKIRATIFEILDLYLRLRYTERNIKTMTHCTIEIPCLWTSEIQTEVSIILGSRLWQFWCYDVNQFEISCGNRFIIILRPDEQEIRGGGGNSAGEN